MCKVNIYLKLFFLYNFTSFSEVSDVAKEDLLSHFEECIVFIENTLANDKKILVHWYKLQYLSYLLLIRCYTHVSCSYFGVSRSAAIVIAYMMKKYKSTFSPAFERCVVQFLLCAINDNLPETLE